MKWFKKWFRERIGRPVQEVSCAEKSEKWFSIFYTLNILTRPVEGLLVDLEAVEAKESFQNDVYALTTIKNFRGDTLDEFLCESVWVIINSEQISEAKFQRHLAKPDSLTALCKSLAERSCNKRRAEVIARPPKCHCQDSPKTVPTNQLNCFARFIQFLRRLRNRLVCKLKECFGMNCYSEDDDNDCGSLETSTFTKCYLCR